MAKRAVIRRGDLTTHGGTVLTGDPTFIVLGREVARVGDSVSCPRCKRTCRIVTGAPTMFDDQLVALHDDVTDLHDADSDNARTLADRHRTGGP